MDVGVDDALRCGPAGTLLRRRQAPLSEDLDRALHVAAGLLKGLLAVHHPGAGALPEPLHLFCADVAHTLSSALSSGLATAVSSPISGPPPVAVPAAAASAASVRPPPASGSAWTSGPPFVPSP